MNLNILSKEDLEIFKKEILDQISTILQKNQNATQWLKTSDVRKYLGISAGTLQMYRIKGIIPYSKIEKTFFYNLQDIQDVLEKNKVSAYSKSEKTHIQPSIE